MLKFYFSRIFKDLRSRVILAVVIAAGILAIPLSSYLYVYNNGIPDVNTVLAAVNPQTNRIEIREIDGRIVQSVAPVTAWPSCGYISTNFGVPHWPYQATHTGLDIAHPTGKIGDPVRPFMAGKVIKAHKGTWGDGYGKHVIVKHGDGLTSLYGHMSGVTVKAGQKVDSRDIIGLMGSTGLSTGSHVHFEVKVSGIPVNPKVFMSGQPKNCKS